MLTRFLKIQLIIFSIVTVTALVGLSLVYLKLPTYLGVGMHRLYAELPNSGGLYKTANVTYLGNQVGKVLSVEPTVTGARVTMDVNNDVDIPDNVQANVHSVSAVGEQFIDLVPPENPSKRYLSAGQTITKGSVPKEVGPALDATQNALASLPKEKIGALLDYTTEAVGGLGPSLQHLVDGTQALAGDFKDNLGSVDDIIQNSAPIIDSQVKSGDAISRWARNLNVLATQSAQQDAALRNAIQQGAPTADQLNAVFGEVRDALPQSLANVEIVLDMLKRYNKGLEQVLVVLPMAGPLVDSLTAVYEKELPINVALGINQPPPCLTGFLPASQWRSPADTSTAPLESGLYCKIPKDAQNTVRGSRNLPCVDNPAKRAASPMECRDNKPYEPLGTNPWYGTPDQIVNCPAPAARCDQPVDPGKVIPAPSINNGLNPLPANMLPPPERASAPSSDPISAPGQGTVECSGQQPNKCLYTPAAGPEATYNPQSGQVVGPNGVKYSVSNSSNPGDDGWKEMLAPAS